MTTGIMGKFGHIVMSTRIDGFAQDRSKHKRSRYPERSIIWCNETKSLEVSYAHQT